MKKILWLIALGMILSGCNSSNLHVYKGENSHWKGMLRLSEADGEVKKEFLLTYKSEIEDLSNIKELSYFYKTPTFDSYKKTRMFLTDGQTSKQFEMIYSDEGTLFAEKDDEIKVIVEKGGKTETFTLTEN